VVRAVLLRLHIMMIPRSHYVHMCSQASALSIEGGVRSATLEEFKPDFSAGVARRIAPQFSACGTGRIALVVVDAVDKRQGPPDVSDEYGTPLTAWQCLALTTAIDRSTKGPTCCA
jgi:hypothetical protein